jgi:hypothetical protein
MTQDDKKGFGALGSLTPEPGDAGADSSVPPEQDTADKELCSTEVSGSDSSSLSSSKFGSPSGVGARSAVLVVSGVLVGALIAFLALKGPSNEQECLIEGLQSVTDSRAQLSIRQACEEQFPGPPSRELTSIEMRLFKVENYGNAGVRSYGGSMTFSGTIYNSLEAFKLTAVIVRLNYTDPASGEERARRYRAVVSNGEPLTRFEFTVRNIPTIEYSNFAGWELVGAEGRDIP